MRAQSSFTIACPTFLYVGEAPRFQEVAANPFSFARYIDDLVAACTGKGVAFRFNVDIAKSPEQLAPFDRVVIASGARYRFGLGGVATARLPGQDAEA